MKRVLLITTDFPPTNRQSSRRAAAMAKYLTICGWQVTVLTSQPTDYRNLMSPEESRANVGIDDAQIIRKLLPPSRPAPRSKLLGKLLGLADILCLPGSPNWRWPRLVLPELDGRGVQADVIWATSPDWGSLRAASQLSKTMRIPWIADFRDAIDQCLSLGRRGWLAGIARWRERSACREPAQITTVSEGLAELLRKRHTALVSVIPNGFDPEWLREVPRKPEGTVFRMVYTGSVWGTQNLTPPVRAADELVAGGAIPESEVEVALYGFDAEYLRAHKLDSLRKPPKAFDKVSLTDALCVQREATVLLVLAMPGTRGVLTTKLFEYMAAGRPVLAYPKDPELDSILRRTGAGVSCDSVDELKAVLLRWYREWKEHGDIRMNRNRNEIMKYSRKEQAKTLAAVLDGVVAAGRR